jgi:hypothetical protein
MVKHVVMWRYKNKADIGTARELLESMKGRVPSLLSIETGVNFLESPASYDLVLITAHKDRMALDEYQADPLHGEIKAALGKLDSERVVVDYEI